MDVLNDSIHFCEQTKAAIKAAHDDDWELSQSIINDRDKRLTKQLSIEFSLLPIETQQELRSHLETLEKLNTELVELAITSQKEIIDKKSAMFKNKSAINKYLDNAVK